MEGPYRDLGSGFARLTGREGARRQPSRLRYVEDALLEMLRNARDAGARSIYVASTLKDRRYRVLTIIDDGDGIPETHAAMIFDPGVTSRHLRPVTDTRDPDGAPHGAGLSLYHIKNAAVSAEVLSAASPTALKFAFDTHTFPERAVQSGSRPSRSNLRATLQRFLNHPGPNLYLGQPARILATLLRDRIIPPSDTASALRDAAQELGLEVSLRTAQRVLRGDIGPLEEVALAPAGQIGGGRGVSRNIADGPLLALGHEESAGIADILSRAARASYLEIGDLETESRPGEISLRARVYEPEDDYE